MIGSPSGKKNLLLSFLPMPRSKGVLIVVPEREIPGIMARAWARPIRKAFGGLRATGGFSEVRKQKGKPR